MPTTNLVAVRYKLITLAESEPQLKDFIIPVLDRTKNNFFILKNHSYEKIRLNKDGKDHPVENPDLGSSVLPLTVPPFTIDFDVIPDSDLKDSVKELFDDLDGHWDEIPEYKFPLMKPLKEHLK